MEKSYIEKVYQKNHGNYAKTYSDLIKENKNMTKQSVKMQLDEYLREDNGMDLRVRKLISTIKYVMVILLVIVTCILVIAYLYSKRMGYGESFVSEMISIKGYEGYLIAAFVFAVLWGLGMLLYKIGVLKNVALSVFRHSVKKKPGIKGSCKTDNTGKK